MASLAAVGPPNPRADPECCSILHGLVAAVEALCKITEYQHEARTMLMENADRVGNRGRIICITNAKRYIVVSVVLAFSFYNKATITRYFVTNWFSAYVYDEMFCFSFQR